jgi:hypothetical protein
MVHLLNKTSLKSNGQLDFSDPNAVQYDHFPPASSNLKIKGRSMIGIDELIDN